jgi:hypothetical protein
MRLIGFDATDLDERIAEVEVWWDRNLRLWAIQSKNAAGDQIGATTYEPQKAGARRHGESLADEAGATLTVRTREEG